MLTLKPKIENTGKLWEEVFGVNAKKVETSYLRNSGISRIKLFQKIAIEVPGREYEIFFSKFTVPNMV